jgi:hypothetical protein
MRQREFMNTTVLTSTPSAVLYGWCRRCSLPRALRTLVNKDNRRARYEICCLACDDVERLSA